MTEMFDLETVSAYVDGDLEPAERVRFEATLSRDKALLDAVEEVRTLRSLAHQVEEAEPARDLWPEIREQVMRPSWWVWFSLPRMQWAPAAVGVVALSLALIIVGVWGTGSEDQHIESELAAVRKAYVGVLDRLEETARTRAARLSPAVRVKLEMSLAAVDQAIKDCEAALAEEPSADGEGHQYLLALYDEKVRVLKSVIDATDDPKPQGRVEPPRGYGNREVAS